MLNNFSESKTGSLVESGDGRTLDLPKLNESITEVDRRISDIVAYLGLPSDNIVQSVGERSKLFRNLESVIDEITVDRSTMIYLSKFIYATADGLFDAALNFLWDATVNELRMRIADFDVEYFYNVAVTSTEKREKLRDAKDLVKIPEMDLLVGAKKIELIDDVSFKELEHINYMRNWASSAHPNKVELTGFQLIDWLEICIRKVFNIPYSSLNLEIKKLLTDIKSRSFSDEEIAVKKQQFDKLTRNQSDTLISGLFGIYVSEKSTSETRSNISKIIEPLWSTGSDEKKIKIGTNYGNFSINGHIDKADKARSFLEIVHGQAYIPQDLKISEISNLLSDLLSANNNLGNFYSEPSLSGQLAGFTDKYGMLPQSIEDEYIRTVIYCFITNGNGVAWNADDNYKLMINKFTTGQSIKALLSFKDEDIFRRLSIKLCADKYKEMLTLIKPQIIQDTPKDFIDYLLSFNADSFSKFVNDRVYKRQFEQYADSFKMKN